MTIKSQFRLLIAVIIVAPLLCAVFIPLYHYFSSPGRILLQGYRQARELEGLNISEDDWDTIHNVLRHMPPDVEAALIVRSVVMISTISDLKEKTVLGEHQLWDVIKATGSEYFYQFETPPIGTKGNKIIIISRVSRNKDKTRKFNNLVFILLISICTFIAICIIAISQIFKTIFISITIIEQQMQKIAGGDLNVKINTKHSVGRSNEITSISNSLEKMRESLHEAQDRRSRFIMGISHDLRTPVAVIKGYTEAISDGVMNSPEEVKDALKIIGTKTGQLENMIDTLINYVKLDSHNWRENLVQEPIEPFLSEFAKTAESTGTIFKRNVKTSIRISPETKIPMNKLLAQRAVENIYSNALRYTKDNDTIIITAEENDSNIIISIADTGYGIDEKDVDHIFDLFYRGTASRHEEGMGIGLSVVKNIMDIHGWTVNVKSRKNEGTEFIITIPK